MMQSVDLGELLARAQAQSSDDNHRPEFPMKEVQRSELGIIREQMSARNGRGVFQQWEEVTPIHRTCCLTNDVITGAVMVFWHYFTKDEALARLKAIGAGGTMYFNPNPDCLIAFLSSQGLRFEVMDSEMLVRVNPEDRQ